MSNFNIRTGTLENFTTENYGWQKIEFETPFPNGTIPQVFVQLQTLGGKNTPGLRIQNVSMDSFEVSMYEVYVSNATSSVVGDLGTVTGNGDHQNAETLAWMAVAIG